ERADLVAVAAGARHAIAAHRAVLDEGQGTPRGLQPGAQKHLARRGEEIAVVSDDGAYVPADLHQPGVGRRVDIDRAAIAHIAVGQHEAGFPIVVLLRDDAVEPDGAVAEPRQAGVPYREPM